MRCRLSPRDEDVERLRALLEDYGHALTDAQREAFGDMRAWLFDGTHRSLSEKQRAWVVRVLEVHRPTYVNGWSSGKVPRGAEVEINCGPKVLRPPGRTP